MIRALLLVAALLLCGSAAQAWPVHGAGNVIQPGSTPFGFWTATATPGQVGNPADYGYGDNVILNFDQPQFQTLTTPTSVGIVAFHTPTATDYSNGVTSNMANVQCAVDNGAFTTVASQSLNAQTGVVDYVFLINPALYSDGEHELRCIGTPTTGQPVVLQGAPSESATVSSLYFNTNVGAMLPSATYYVNASTGNDANACSVGAPCLTIYGAIAKYCVAIHGSTACNAGADVGGLDVCPSAGSYSFGNPVANVNYLAASQWVTVNKCGNTSVVLNTIGSTVGLRTAKVRLLNLSVNFSGTAGASFVASLQESQSITPAIWLDGVSFTGAGQAYSNAQPVSAPQTTWKGGAYETNVTITAGNNGCIGANLCRNVNMTFVSSDSFQSSTTVLNSTVANSGGFYYGPTGVLTGATTGTATLNSWCITALSNSDPQDFPVGGSIAAALQGGSFGVFPTNTTIVANDGSGPHSCAVGTVEISGQATGNVTGQVFSTGSHPDVYQSISVASNTIIYGVVATNTISQQGLFIQGSANQTDFAFVNNTFHNDGSLRVMQSAALITNGVWINNSWIGPMFWNGGTAVDLAIINNTCGSTPGPLAGVTYRGGSC